MSVNTGEAHTRRPPTGRHPRSAPRRGRYRVGRPCPRGAHTAVMECSLVLGPPQTTSSSGVMAPSVAGESRGSAAAAMLASAADDIAPRDALPAFGLPDPARRAGGRPEWTWVRPRSPDVRRDFMTGGIPGVPGNELLHSLSADLTAAVRQEFQVLQHELTSPFRRAGGGARLLGGSAVLGSMAAGGATALAIRLLDRRLTAAASAAGGAGAPGGRAPGLGPVRPGRGRAGGGGRGGGGRGGGGGGGGGGPPPAVGPRVLTRVNRRGAAGVGAGPAGELAPPPLPHLTVYTAQCRYGHSGRAPLALGGGLTS